MAALVLTWALSEKQSQHQRPLSFPGRVDVEDTMAFIFPGLGPSVRSLPDMGIYL